MWFVVAETIFSNGYVTQGNYLRSGTVKDCFDTYPELAHSVHAVAEVGVVANKRSVDWTNFEEMAHMVDTVWKEIGSGLTETLHKDHLLELEVDRSQC